MEIVNDGCSGATSGRKLSLRGYRRETGERIVGGSDMTEINKKEIRGEIKFRNTVKGESAEEKKKKDEKRKDGGETFQ